jgi:hypothetical protein
VRHASAAVRDRIVPLGVSRADPWTHPTRVIAVTVGAGWRPSPTNVLDPAVLAVADAVGLDDRRRKIEGAFLVATRLVGVSDRWSGAYNAIARQVWSTWLRDAGLVDLADAVTEGVGPPLDAMSVALACRGLGHDPSAFGRGQAGADPVAGLAAHDDLGLVKRRRTSRARHRATRDPWQDELHW